MRVRGNFRIRSHSARRLGVAATGLALLAGVLPVVDAVVPGATGVARANDVTASQNLLRNGWDNGEPNMGPSVVPSFVQRFNAPVQGAVFAQPLVLGSTVIVATENDQVYGLDAGTGAVKWWTSLGSPYAISSDSTFTKCTDLVPNIGVTGTPAFDPVTGHIFMFANILTGGAPAYYMVEMDPTTGTVVSKTLISGHPTNDASITFSAKYNMERPGVLVMDGAVYGAFASHCDFKPYTGYVARVDLSTHTAKLWSDESGVTNNQAGIWQSGGGIMSDGSGRIFVTSGNGVSPVKRAGTSPGSQLAESVIRLAPNTTTGSVSAQDFFSPANAPTLDAGDVDYGAGGPVGVQFPIGPFSTLAQIGKDGRIWLLNRNGLGGRQQGPNSTDNSLFVSKAYGGEWGHPAIFGDTPVTIANSHTTAVDNDFLFSVGKDDVMRVFRFYESSAGKPGLTNLANSSLTYGFTSGSPVVTSNGDDPTSAVIWEVFTPNTTGKTGVGSMLEAYSLGNVASNGTTPSPCTSIHMCTLTNIWHSGTFTSAKFSIPATSQGWVYVGTRDGHLLAFASPSAAAPAAPLAATLPQTAVGSTSSQPVSVTATKTVTITGATASTGANNTQTTTATEFTAGQASVTKHGSSTAVPVTFPVTLAKGDKLSVQTSFTPAVPGGSSGTLSLSTNSSAAPTVDVPLTAEGTTEGIVAQPSTQTFPLAPDQGVTAVPIGIQKPEIVTISNLGTATQTITSVTPPSAPFSASNLPVVGTKLNPGASIAVQVTYAPTSPGPATGSFTIAGSSGQQAVVGLSGIGTPAVSQLTASSPSVNFGTIPVGKKATAYFQVSNTGNTQSTVNGVANLKAPFAAPLKPDVGLPFNSDSDLLLPVTFTPTVKGNFSTQYKLQWRDVNGSHTVIVTITGTGA
ncbi:MAG TPA: choice-of-anchor D domain-containing protein [Streptosporangiaceae bacterium]|nr:choice-of-anchor D domain-containing protein [Streptosporangiaceae bacterium]